MDVEFEDLNGFCKHCQRSYAMYDNVSSETNISKASIKATILQMIVPRYQFCATSITKEFGKHTNILNKSISDKFKRNMFVNVIIVPLRFRTIANITILLPEKFCKILSKWILSLIIILFYFFLRSSQIIIGYIAYLLLHQ